MEPIKLGDEFTIKCTHVIKITDSNGKVCDYVVKLGNNLYLSEKDIVKNGFRKLEPVKVELQFDDIILFEHFENTALRRIINKNIIGKDVLDSNDHLWKIVHYDDTGVILWYNDSIGKYTMHGRCNDDLRWEDVDLIKMLNGSLFYDTRKFPSEFNEYITPLLSQDKKDDVIILSTTFVWLPSQAELGFIPMMQDAIFEYFKEDPENRACRGCVYWTRDVNLDGSCMVANCVGSIGALVPELRVDMANDVCPFVKLRYREEI